jgi:hypothetical protein
MWRGVLQPEESQRLVIIPVRGNHSGRNRAKNTFDDNDDPTSPGRYGVPTYLSRSCTPRQSYKTSLPGNVPARTSPDDQRDTDSQIVILRPITEKYPAAKKAFQDCCAQLLFKMVASGRALDF